MLSGKSTDQILDIISCLQLNEMEYPGLKFYMRKVPVKCKVSVYLTLSPDGQ